MVRKGKFMGFHPRFFLETTDRGADCMHTKQVGTQLFLIDLQTGGFRNLIGSYVLKGEKTLIVETGPTSSIPNLLRGLRELQVNSKDVAYVAVTHVHIDHSGGAGILLKNLPNAQVIVHPKGAAHLVDPAKLWLASQKTLGGFADMFGKPEPVPEDRIIAASDGMVFDLGEDLKLQALEAPGHAAHNMGFYDSLNGAIFPGDSAGAYLQEFNTVFPTTPPPFRPDVALASLEKIIRLKPKLVCYSHFGEAEDAVRRLRDYQVQIRRWTLLVQEGLKQGELDEEIRERVLREDETIREVVPMLRANPVHRKTLIENSVQGFIEFARNLQI
jgi:glyoxylase-like metal-dependent hydrolase (beta-lactamase superfamily II)